MQRRPFLLMTAGAFGVAGAPSLVYAHHGWSGFDQDKPLFVEGEAAAVAWRNPHVEVKLKVPADLRVPADLPRRNVPAQSATVDAARILAAAKVPVRKVAEWEVELAPLSRMEAWKVAEIRPGQRIAVVGYTLPGEQGEAVIRAEYLFVGDRAYGLRSSPA